MKTEDKELKELQDSIQESISALSAVTSGPIFNNSVPIGVPVPWFRHLYKAGITPSIPPNWVECNGQKIVDTDSPLDGSIVPNINGQGLFLRGSATSGTAQAADTLVPAHTHTDNFTLPNHTHTHSLSVSPSTHVHSERGATLAGGTTNRVRLELQTNNLASGSVTDANGVMSVIGSIGNPSSLPAIDGAITSSGGSGVETRPANISAVYIMRIKD